MIVGTSLSLDHRYTLQCITSVFKIYFLQNSTRNFELVL